MSSAPLASVIIICFNQESYIEQALLSVINQKTTFPFEIIVGNDASTDGTGQIIEQVNQQYPGRLSILPGDTNLGPVANEYRCFQAAKGEYIAFLEGDDYWVGTERLQKQVSYMEDHKNCGLVHGDVHHYNVTDKTWIKNYNEHTKSQELVDDYSLANLLVCQKHFVKTMTSCFRKSIIENNKVYETAIDKGWLLTDLAIWYELCQHSTCHYFDEVFAVYRLQKNSVSRSSSAKRVHKFHLSVYNIRYFYWQKYLNSPDLKIIIDQQMAYMLLGDAYNAKSSAIAKEARNAIKQSKVRLNNKQGIMYFLSYFFWLWPSQGKT